MSVTLADVQNQVASLKQVAYRTAPIPAALASWSFIGFERLGEKATSTRKRRLSLLSVGLMMVFVGPAAAQATGCKSGPLSFLSNIHSLITKGAGTVIVSMVLVAGVLKMIPMRGTNSWGNALIGSIIVGVLFLVIGPALVDLADQSTDLKLNSQCTGGSGGGGSGGE
jgi:hypothetical protein